MKERISFYEADKAIDKYIEDQPEKTQRLLKYMLNLMQCNFSEHEFCEKLNSYVTKMMEED